MPRPSLLTLNTSPMRSYRSPAYCFIFCLLGIFGCATAAAQKSESPGLHSQTLSVESDVREFSYYIPSESTGSPMPIVIYLHGHGDSMQHILGTGRIKSASSVWMDVAEREGFMVMYPLGLKGGGRRPKTGWNDCRTGLEGNPQSDDVAFIRHLIDYAVEQHDGDRNRVYVTGMSNGGHMTMRAGMEMTDDLAAIAPLVALLPKTHNCKPPPTPISVLLMYGTNDPLAPFEGGAMAGGRGEVFSARETTMAWATWNGLENVKETTIELADKNSADGSTVVAHIRETSPAGPAVIAYEMRGAGHTEPSKVAQMGRLLRRIQGNRNQDIEMAETIWAFFKTRSR